MSKPIHTITGVGVSVGIGKDILDTKIATKNILSLDERGLWNVKNLVDVETTISEYQSSV